MDVAGIALITGAGSGIGKACAHAFAEEGASGLVLLDINNETLETVKKEIEIKQQGEERKPCTIELFSLDVTNEDQVNAAVASAVTSFSRLDYVICAAGIAFKHKGGAAYARSSDWHRVIDVNLNGTYYVLRAAAKIMLEQTPIVSSIDSRPLQRGSIVLFSSILGHVGVPLSTAYTAAKHAVLGLMRTTSEDYASKGLRINAVCPGYIETPMTMHDGAVRQAMDERLKTSVPMGRMGQAKEVADAVVWLAGGRSSFVTGTSVAVDGGYLQR